MPPRGHRGVVRQAERVKEIDTALEKMPGILEKRDRGPFSAVRIQMKENRGGDFGSFIPTAQRFAKPQGADKKGSQKKQAKK